LISKRYQGLAVVSKAKANKNRTQTAPSGQDKIKKQK